MNVKYKLLKNGAIAPTYGTNGSACFDLYMCEDHVFPQGEWDTVSLGIAFEVPKGHVMKMYPRSSTCNRGLRLSNSVGVIDSDYRGPVHVAMDNVTNQDVLVRAGERIVQAMVIPVEQCDFEQVKELSETERGDGGFGSTGK